METVFTKIARKEIPAYIVDETEDFMAFLDINPAVYGQTLVIPKQWRHSYVFKHEDEFMAEFWKYIRRIAKLLDAKLGSERCVLIFEGFELNHLHAKLFPVMEGEAESFNPRNKIEFNENIAKEILKKIKS